MTSKIGDYFIPSNAVNNITDEDYKKVDLLVNAAKAFARSTHQCVYIINYFKKESLYASENFYYLCGIVSTQLSCRRCGAVEGSKGINNIPPSDIILNINHMIISKRG